MLSSCSVNPHYPKAPHVTFALTAMSVGMAQGLYQRLFSLLKKTVTAATVTLSHLKQSLVTVASGYSALDP
jgi:hypothetical protein